MVLGRNRGSIMCSSFPGGKSVRAKKYGCGRASGETQAATALRPASGEPPLPASAATRNLVNFLAAAGTNQAVRISLASRGDRKSTRLNSSHVEISYAVFCLKKKKKTRMKDIVRH